MEGARRAFATELPPGFDVHRAPGAVLVCRAGTRDALERGGLSVDGRHTGSRADRLDDAEESGREPLGKLDLDGTPCLVRRFTHGGLARAVTGRRFRDPNRPFVELALSERLRALDVPTPRVVAARAVGSALVGYELTLVVEREPDTTDLGIVLGRVRRGATAPTFLRGALEAAARSIARMHEIGFVHADLQPANLLVDRTTPGDLATVLDLDRSSFEDAPLAHDRRVSNLGRLWRHVRRREDEYGATLSNADRLRFLRAYGCERSEWGRTAAAIDDAASQRRGLHGIGWKLERWFGRGKDTRAAR